MGVFYSAPHIAEAPHQVAANTAFYLATLLAGVSACQTLWSGPSQPIPLMLACWCILLGLWKPLLFLPVYKAWCRSLNLAARVLLTVYWVVYVLPAGLSMQLRGHDPLQRRFNPKSATYWQDPQPATDMRKLS